MIYYIISMTYASKPLIDALKRARTRAGLSQRALSTRTGLPQSHISRIESGRGDITLSTLVDLARALDMELMLVPRKMIPAVENITRSEHTETEAATAPPPAYQLDDEDDDEEFHA